jgi:hypothetical protein
MFLRVVVAFEWIDPLIECIDHELIDITKQNY